MVRGLHPTCHRPVAICVVGCLIAYLAAYAATPASITYAQTSAPGAAAANPVTWLIFVDDLHLDFRNTGRIRDAMRVMAAELIRDGDTFAIGSSGPSMPAVDVSADRQLLQSAIKKATGNGLRFDDIIHGANGSAEVRYRTSTAVMTAQEMLNDVARLPDGPRALLYLSNGYSFDLLPDRTPASPSLGQGFDFNQSQVRDQLTELTAIATRAAVRIFAIDLRVAFEDPVPVPNDPESTAHRTAMHGSLRSLSDATGGFAIVDGDFLSALKRISTLMGR
jgi:hypothetical protein